MTVSGPPAWGAAGSIHTEVLDSPAYAMVAWLLAVTLIFR
jgi:hypothetical protein